MSTKRKKPVIELHNGFFWDCEECGKENFVRAVGIPLLPGDREYLKELYKVNKKDEEKTMFLQAPTNVVCEYCKENYDCKIQSF
jgi:hypothetical protein